jgi:hypothetical protein
MSKDRKKSPSSNSNDNEKDFLEEEFLKFNIDEIPIPISEIEIYDEEVQEVMKSGCNRQIAEYALLKYKEIEDSEAKENGEGYKKLIDLKKEYQNHMLPIIKRTWDALKNFLQNPVIKTEETNLEGYDDEIEKILTNPDIEQIMKEKEKKKLMQPPEYYAKFFLKEEIDKYEEKDNFTKARNSFIEKREAVIEFALRKVKKIVNDEKEYDIFSQEYNQYQKKEKAKNKNN